MSSARDDGQAAERVVIRDKRKIDPTGGKAKDADTATADETDEAPAEATKDSAATDGAAKKERKPSHAAPDPEDEEEASTSDAPPRKRPRPPSQAGRLAPSWRH
ncbi:hypothetical protein Phou_039460 [Phytohabitans houttuyneae]|uniref:Uncharacterized protein n=1 Tax=Phytohabitans houttuyneae TaxID=1076126 RepID=A0A6V8KCQ1_9ACTN|nr:hypothetical protein Phou_039460 [Phytohabitans houttuyneae]